MNLKKELGLEENEKSIIFITYHDGVYICESSLVYEEFIENEDIKSMKIKDNVFIIKTIYGDTYNYDLNEYDVYSTEFVNQVIVAFEPSKITTNEELNA